MNCISYYTVPIRIYFVITETWLHVDILSSLLDPKGLFTVLRRDRIVSRGGGVCVLVRKPLRVIGIDLGNEFDDPEMICFDLILTGNHTRFYALYRPPGYDSDALCYVCKLVKCLTRLESTKYPNIILGDVNLLKVNWNNFSGPGDAVHLTFLSFLLESSFTQLVTFSTRGSNILDVILTTVPSLFGKITCDTPIGDSDHSSVRFELLVSSRPRINNYHNEQPVSNVKYNWHQGDYDAICMFLSGIDWLSVIHSNPSALVVWEVFISILYAAIDMYVPRHSQSSINRSGRHGYRTREISRCTAKTQTLAQA